MGLAQNSRARVMQVLLFGSICQGAIFGTCFLSHTQYVNRLRLETPLGFGFPFGPPPVRFLLEAVRVGGWGGSTRPLSGRIGPEGPVGWFSTHLTRSISFK